MPTLLAACAQQRLRKPLPRAAQRIEVQASVLIWNSRSRWRRGAAVLTAALAWNAVTGLWAHAQPVTTLTVSVAASLQNAMRDVGRAFEAQHAGTRVQFNVAASGALLAQIAQGAPVDVLATADTETMDRAQAGQLIVAATRVPIATTALVLISPANRTLRLQSTADLLMPAVQRIAIGTPTTVPAGRYAQSAFEAQGLWSALRPKLVFADSVRQVLTYVARGEADAGVVYRTDALMHQDAVRIDLVLPTTSPVTYPMAVVAASAHAAAAAAFVGFARGAQGQAVMARYGFARP